MPTASRWPVSRTTASLATTRCVPATASAASAADTGQRWQDIVRWNNIDNPDLIEVGQVLRVIPPSGTAVASAPPASASSSSEGATTKPVTPPPALVPTAPAQRGQAADARHGLAFGSGQRWQLG
jgi:hypothetical protein